MKYYRFLLVIAATIFSQACSSLFVSEPKFIHVSGTQFELAGKPYYFVGTNFWYGCYLGAKGETGNRERLIKELDNLKSLGITNLRILAASEESEMKNSLKPAIQNSLGVYNEDLLEGLDFLLSEMRKRDMHAVIFLNNYWEWSGGMAQYNSWVDRTKLLDPYDPKVGWGNFMTYSASFYRNVKANEYFREFIKKIVTRKNKFTGDFYFEDPAIMAWQLANEPRPGRGEESMEFIDQFYKWVDGTAQFIKSLDPNHLVTTGSEGLAGALQSEEIYLKMHSGKYIDYITLHLWAKNWGWFDAKKINETYLSAETKAVDYLNKHIRYARLLGKPTVMEEFGMSRDNELCKTGTPTTARDTYFKKLFDVVYDSASAGAPIAGTNFWTWGGAGRGKNDDNMWRPGDPFVGDPPQEPQGFNSIFDTDKSTLTIIKTHAEKMQRLCEKELIQKKIVTAAAK